MNFSIFEQSKEIKDLLFNYPSFIKARKINNIKNEIPVFVFHSIKPDSFESQLRYLQDNNYNTLSISEFENKIVNKSSLAINDVLLTIDDARLSFWKYGYPLLKKYHMKATLFIIPGRTIDNQKERYNLDDVWNGRISGTDLAVIDPHDDELCNWNEIREMYSSKIINIESHTLFHGEVFVSKKLMNIVTNSSEFHKYNSDISPYFNNKDIGKELVTESFYGYPLFETSPLMLGFDRYEIDDKLINFCRNSYKEYYNQNGNWKKKLYVELSEKLKNDEFKFEKQNGRNAVKSDLEISKKLIQEKLDSKAGNSLCLPWTIGNELTIEVLKEIGISSCFWGVLDNKKTNKPGDDPYYICRIKNDFIFRLPGKGRKSLASIYFSKMQRRIKNEPIY